MELCLLAKFTIMWLGWQPFAPNIFNLNVRVPIAATLAVSMPRVTIGAHLLLWV